MSDAHERTILDSARYLRNVRPIDPRELATYVSGDRSPATVSRILREHATDLGILERTDGCFEAVGDTPISVSFEGVDRIPDAIDEAIECQLIESFGEEWATGQSGDMLREAIREFKHDYFAGEPVEYDHQTALGYSIYHIPSSFASVQYVLDELGESGLLSDHLRILDIGAGVGGQALGIDAYLPDDVLVDYTAVEASLEAISILEKLLEQTGRNFHPAIIESSIESAEIAGPFDIILYANVLSELAAPARSLERITQELAPAGSIVAIEPADERTSRGLRTIERQLCGQSSVDVFSPTLRLWPGVQPTDDCWSFRRHTDLSVPRTQVALDEASRIHNTTRPPATGEFRNVDVQYSYGIYRRDDTRRIRYRPDRKTATPLQVAADRVTDRVAVSVVKLSHSLTESSDANPLYVIGDGSQSTEWFAVQTATTHMNRQLKQGSYGDVLLIANGLVLWNEDEVAYNLIIDEESVIDRVTPTGLEPA